MDNDDIMEPPPSTLVPIYGPDIVERARYLAGDNQSLDRIWHICAWLRDWERMKMRTVPGYAAEHGSDEYL